MIHLLPGTILNRQCYRIIRFIGKGGFGITYLAEEIGYFKQNGYGDEEYIIARYPDKVVVKELFYNDFCYRDENTGVIHVTDIEQRIEFEKLVNKQLEEGKILRSLKHPNIIYTRDIFKENATAYMVMSYVESTDLAELLKKLGRFQKEKAVRYIKEVLSAVSYIHGLKILHLDINPGNILIKKETDEAVLIDFGASLTYNEAEKVKNNTSKLITGIKKHFAPNEQADIDNLKKFDATFDTYAVAATLYNLLTGELPPLSSMVSSGRQKIIVPSVYNAAVSDYLDAVIVKAMNPLFGNRYKSAVELNAALNNEENYKHEINNIRINVAGKNYEEALRKAELAEQFFLPTVTLSQIKEDCKAAIKNKAGEILSGHVTSAGKENESKIESKDHWNAAQEAEITIQLQPVKKKDPNRTSPSKRSLFKIGIPLLLILLVIFYCLIPASKKLPAMISYPDVVKIFLSHYLLQNDDSGKINFAKKRDGWYVQLIKTQPDTVLRESLFWSLKNKSFIDISNKFTVKSNGNPDSLFSVFFSTIDHLEWYKYERCTYYGYKNWENDVISDFNDYTIANDTLTEGIARANLTAAENCLNWNAATESYTKPTAQQLSKALKYLDKMIEMDKQLFKNNPSYITYVGPIETRLNNDRMYAWMRLIVEDFEKEADQYLQQVTYDSLNINFAKNYLNSCPENAILLINNDSPTYQLWYVQQKLHYRTDVSIICIGLLSSDIYNKWLLEKNILMSNMPKDAFLGKETDIVYYDTEHADTSTIGIELFLSNLYSKKQVGSYKYNYLFFENKQLELRVNPENFPSMHGDLLPFVKINLNSNYLYRSDLIMLDLLKTSSYFLKRPICTIQFDGVLNQFSNYFFSMGSVFRFIPFERNNNSNTKDAENLCDYIRGASSEVISKENSFIPVVTNSQKNVEATDLGNSLFFGYFSYCINFQLLNKNDVAARNLAFQALQHIVVSDNYYANGSVIPFALSIAKTGYKVQAKKMLENMAKSYEQIYEHPTAVFIYINRQRLKQLLTELNDQMRDISLESEIIDSLIKKYP